MLYQLIYASRASQPLGPADVKTLLQRSRRANARIGVSGALVVFGQHFLQLLEGEAHTVCQLYQRILGDPLHEDAVLLAFSEIDRRHFGEWAMGLLPVTADNRALLLEQANDEFFDPLKMAPTDATHLFDRIHDNVRWLS